MKYKPHRSTLAETMKEIVEFDNIEDFKNFFKNSYGVPKTINFEFYAKDSRIDWDLYTVNLEYPSGHVITNVGFSNSKL